MIIVALSTGQTFPDPNMNMGSGQSPHMVNVIMNQDMTTLPGMSMDNVLSGSQILSPVQGQHDGSRSELQTVQTFKREIDDDAQF